MTEDVHDQCVSVCEIVGGVDIGDVLMQETYLNKTDSPAVFTVYEGIVGPWLKFSGGVDSFDRSGSFCRLEAQANELTQSFMDHEYMVGLFIAVDTNC